MDISKMNKLFIDSELKNSQRDILLSRIMNTNDDNDVNIYLRDQSIIQQFIGNTAIITGHGSFIIVTHIDHDNVSIMVGGTDPGRNYKITSSVDKDTYSIKDVYAQDISYMLNKKTVVLTENYTDDYIRWTLAGIIIQFHILAMHPEYYDQKIVYAKNTSKKGNKAPHRVIEYRLNKRYFINDYIGARYSKWDRISIGNNYNLYDPNSILIPVFPLQHGVITSGFENLTSRYDDRAVISRNITMKLAIAFNVISKSTISIKAYALNIDGKGEIISNCIYDFKSGTFERISDDNFVDTVRANVSEVIDEAGDNDIINLCIDVLKYMAYHVELVSKNDVVTGSIKGSSNYTPKANDKPRFETSICSYKVYGITKKVIPVTEAEAKEKRKYTPCQYAVTVKGHFRHYKSGKVIWVEHYIRNKDKEFKPKDYVDKKKEG